MTKKRLYKKGNPFEDQIKVKILSLLGLEFYRDETTNKSCARFLLNVPIITSHTPDTLAQTILIALSTLDFGTAVRVRNALKIEDIETARNKIIQILEIKSVKFGVLN